MKHWIGVLPVSMLSVILWGQTGTSRITGTVVDPSGATLTGAKVTAQNEATNVAWATTSGASGSYSLESIPPGRYSIKVEAAGFKTIVSHANILSIGQPTTVNAQMQLGSTSESVDVVGTAETVQTSSSGNFGNIVDQKAVTELPIVGVRGRNPLGLVNFQPGIVVGGNASASSVHAHGARDRAWNYTLDGVDINETSAPGGNFSPLRTNPDMLAEFRVITGNATADQGRASGGDVAMVTRSGTNQFHGNAFFFYQTPSFNANTVQNKLSPPFLPRDQFVQKIGGFSLGGPIWKNKTFFFGNFQFLRTLRTQKITRLVYTDQARHGIFRYVTQPPGNPDSVRNEPASGENPSVDFQGNVLPGVNISTYDVVANDPDGVGLDPQLADFIGLTPLPNDFSESGDGLNVAGFTWVPAEKENQSDYLIKVDHVFNDRHSVFVRWASGHQDTNGDIANDGQAPFPGTPNWVNTQRTPRNLAINWRWVPTSHSTNELVLGMNRFTFGFANGDPKVNSNPPFVLNNMDFSDLPLHNDQGNFRALTTYQLSDNFSLAKGAHSLRWGGQILYQRHVDDRGSIGNFNTNPWVFFDRFTNPVSPSAFNLPASEDEINSSDYGTLRSTVNDLLGRVGEIDIGLASANDSSFRPVGSFFNFDSRFPEYDLYVQDNWKIRPNLVIDAGIRWEIRMSPQNPHNQILRPDQPMVFNGTPSDNVSWVPGNLYNNAFKNVGPSIGIAWDPKGNGKMSVRANYRLAYDRINTFVVSSGIIQTLPGLTYSYANTAFGSDGGRLADGLPSLVPSDVTPGSLRTPPPFSTNFATVMDPNIVTPRTHMWGLSIQRELPGQLVLEANYIGRHGSHLFGGYDANAHEIFSNGFLDGFKQLKAGQDSPLFDALLANYDNLDAGQTGSQYMMDNFGREIGYNSIGELAKFINQTLSSDGVTPIVVANGFSPFFFTRYPQFADEVDTLDTNDWSNYHALELQLQRRFNNGLQFQMSYTFAKSLDTRSFDPAFSTIPTGRSQSSANIPFDNQDRRRNYARSDFDRRHALQGDFVWDLPFGQGGMWLKKDGWVERVVGGWSLAGILTLQSGRPFTVYSGGYTFNDTVMTPASCDGCSPDMGKLHWEGGDPFSADASRYYFTPEQRAKFFQPEAGQLSNIGRNHFTLPPNFNLDMALGKRFRITEAQDLQLRLEVQNLTNSVVFDAPTTGSSDITGSTFGLMTRIYNTPRKMQVSAKYTF